MTFGFRTTDAQIVARERWFGGFLSPTPRSQTSAGKRLLLENERSTGTQRSELCSPIQRAATERTWLSVRWSSDSRGVARRPEPPAGQESILFSENLHRHSSRRSECPSLSPVSSSRCPKSGPTQSAASRIAIGLGLPQPTEVVVVWRMALLSASCCSPLVSLALSRPFEAVVLVGTAVMSGKGTGRSRGGRTDGPVRW